ncbi:hypothetical protein [Emticicia sp.]|uniref:hypothetical protein n=1 Tax=Emticicia sp. TaxID=1930953 RepID=UPI0037527E17
MGIVKTLLAISCKPITRNKSIILTVSLDIGIDWVEEFVDTFMIVGSFYVLEVFMLLQSYSKSEYSQNEF